MHVAGTLSKQQTLTMTGLIRSGRTQIVHALSVEFYREVSAVWVVGISRCLF